MGVGVFWGLILIVIGVSIIFKVVFDINLFRVVIAVVFILIGIKILIGRPNIRMDSKDNDVIFNEKIYTSFPSKNTEYNNIFGKSVYDFRNADYILNKNLKLEFNAIFGSSLILLPKDLPVEIQADAVFASAKLPNQNSTSFGTTEYRSVNENTGNYKVKMKVAAVFGSIEVRK